MAAAPQSAQQEWMAKPPEPVPGCPPGLEYLSMIDQLLIHQQIELLEAITGWETSNRFQIKNSMGQQVYFASEESGLCMRQCCKSGRAFIMHITDNNNQEVIRVTRELQCCAGCCWCANTDCCAFLLTVESPPGQVVGYVRQSQSKWKPKFSIRDVNNQEVLQINGPCCGCQALCCRGDIDFKVSSIDGNTEVGKISKQWAGLVRDMFTQADNFGVTFPMDLEVKMKACLLAATFLIDFMYFEEN